MKLSSREDQDRALRALMDEYPDLMTADEMRPVLDCDQQELSAMLRLLEGNGLVECIDGAMFSHGGDVAAAKITALGISRLNEDAGLGRSVRTVTVEFEADTLRALMLARVQSSDLPGQERSRLQKLIQAAGDEALRTVAKTLTQAALSRWPDAVRLVQTALSGQ